MRKEFYIKNIKDQKISAVLYSKNGKIENKQTLIMCHGFTGHKEELWYPEFFSRLVKNNYQVVSFDMNGHGISYGRFIDFTISKAVDDFKTVYYYLEKRGVKRIGIMGHSIGGAACLLVANKINIQSLILLSPVSRPSFYNRYLTPKKLDQDFLSNFGFYPRHSFKRGKYYPVGINFFRDFEKQSLIIEVKAIKKPILLIHAGQDKAVPITDSRRIFKILDFDITSLKVINRADHNFSHFRDHQSVIKLSLDWLDKYLKKCTDNVMTAYIKRNDGRVLVLKRSKKVGFYPNQWSGVGGFIVPGENIIRRAKQEIREELGINPGKLELSLITSPFTWEDEKYDRVWRMRWLLFKAKKIRVRINWENLAYRWIMPKLIHKLSTVPNQVSGFKKLKLI